MGRQSRHFCGVLHDPKRPVVSRPASFSPLRGGACPPEADVLVPQCLLLLYLSTGGVLSRAKRPTRRCGHCVERSCNEQHSKRLPTRHDHPTDPRLRIHVRHRSPGQIKLRHRALNRYNPQAEDPATGARSQRYSSIPTGRDLYLIATRQGINGSTLCATMTRNIASCDSLF